MSRAIANRNRRSGFSLVELLIAMAVAMIVLGAAALLLRQALHATFTMTSKADMLQNARGALNQISRDISRAGVGMPPGGISLASGTGVNPRFGCDFAQCYIPNNAFTGSHMYSVNPGWRLGINNEAGIA